MTLVFVEAKKRDVFDLPTAGILTVLNILLVLKVVLLRDSQIRIIGKIIRGDKDQRLFEVTAIYIFVVSYVVVSNFDRF